MRYLWALGVVFLGISAVVFLLQSNLGEQTVSAQVTQLDVDNIEETLKARMQEVGPIAAREELKELYRTASVGDSHEAGHVFGRLIFETYDKEGLSYCDEGFTFGCYHEFFGWVIHRDGIGVVSELNQRCFDSHERLADGFACQHGLGHGLQVQAGYELEGLRDALALCHTLEPLDSINGCYGGAVMEYNMKTMLYAHGIPPRDFVPEQGYLYPCSDIPDYATQACYYWLSQWWLFALELDAVEVGNLCRSVESEIDESACFFGIGNRIPDLTRNAQAAVDLCVTFSGDTTNYEQYVDCLASAAVTYAESSLPDQGREVCESLRDDPEAFQYCDRIRRN